MRIFTLLACLMLVLAVAERAGDPRTWKWLFQLDSKTAAPEEPKVRNRLDPEVGRTEHDPPGTFVASAQSDAERLDDQAESGAAALDPVERAWEQGWREIMRTLTQDERELVFRWLLAGQAGKPLAEDIRTPSEAILETINSRWKDYGEKAFNSVGQMKEDRDKALWVDVLRRVNGRWFDEVQPALKDLAQGGAPTPEQQAAIAKLEQTLRKLALDRVNDDTVFRAAEHDIVMHLFAQLQRPVTEASPRPEEALYLQLFKQPQDYRGKLVTFTGVVRGAYRVDAPDNYLGIDEYFVLWLHPSSGPDSPIVIYALEVPEGFPAIKHRDREGGITRMHEDATVAGYFLKRWAYQAADGMYTAPLVLARTFEWKPRERMVGADRVFTWQGILTIIGIAAAGTGLAMAFILWRLKRDTQQSVTHSFHGPADSPEFKDLNVGPTTREALGELQREAQAAEQTPPRETSQESDKP